MSRPSVFRSLCASILPAAVLMIAAGCQQKSNEDRFLESAPPGVGGSGGPMAPADFYEKQGYPGTSPAAPDAGAAPVDEEAAAPVADTPAEPAAEDAEPVVPAPLTEAEPEAAPSLEPPAEATTEPAETP